MKKFWKRFVSEPWWGKILITVALLVWLAFWGVSITLILCVIYMIVIDPMPAIIFGIVVFVFVSVMYYFEPQPEEIETPKEEIE